MSDVPVQYFQSVIAVELAITAGLLYQIRFFEPRRPDESDDGVSNPWLRLLVAVVLGSTVFGALASIRHQAGPVAATSLAVGVALSLVPILLRVLPPLARETQVSRAGPSGASVTWVALALYLALVIALVVTLNT